MLNIEIAPFSVNKFYKGRKIASDELLKFKRDFGILLPKKSLGSGKLLFTACFGTSSRVADLDNMLKATIDTIAEKWDFNDKMIYEILVKKIDVEKGKEFISFKIDEIKDM